MLMPNAAVTVAFGHAVARVAVLGFRAIKANLLLRVAAVTTGLCVILASSVSPFATVKRTGVTCLPFL